MILIHNQTVVKGLWIPCLALSLLACTTSAPAGVMLSFKGTPGSFPGSGDTSVIVSDPSTVPAVVTIDVDGAGIPSIFSVTSPNPPVTDLWTVSGVASGGFNSRVVLTLTGEGINGPQQVRQRHPEGIGVRGSGGNSGRIDAEVGDDPDEAINIHFDATDAGLAGLQLSLVSVGVVDANNQGEFIPDIGITDFDGVLRVIPDYGDGDDIPDIFPVPSPAALIGGSMGQVSFSQPDPAPQGEGENGYRLASIEFDVVPEPSSFLLLAIAGALLAQHWRRHS